MPKILRLPQVIERTGKRRSAIYADLNAGAFPRPVKLSPKAVGWLESEIDDWIAARVSERDRRLPKRLTRKRKSLMEPTSRR